MEAAVSISEGSISAVLEKLHLLVAECSRIKGVRSQVGFLRSELASIHALLRKVAAMEDPDIQVKAWAREVREMAYDIEDCVDAFMHRLGGGDEPHGQGGIKEFFGKCARFLLALRSRHQFANQIDELKSRLVEVGERRERYKLDDLACGNSGRMVVDPRLSALFADEDQPVGIDGPSDELAKWMVEGESGLAKHRKVLSRSKIAFLISELNNMYAFHQKVTMMEDPDVQVKAWAREVRELAYDIEDCIDKFMHSLSLGIKRKRRKTGGIRELFHTCVSFLHSLRSWHQIASKIDELKTRVVAVREQRNSYKLDGLASGTSCSEKIVVDPRLSALFAEEACLVGIEGPRDDLVNWLVHGETGLIKHRKVLSIVGFGGLGKTTLANEVYRKIRANFHYHAFVSLSQKPDMKKILISVLFQLHLEDSFAEVAQTLDERDLILKLRELLQDKRYLIVIDDVWSMSAWDTIKCAFPENNCCSRIIATTRIIDVAHSCSCGDGRVYEIEPLNDLDSKRLFFRRIFGTEDCHHHHLQEVSNEILKKCGGLPLAILSLSSLLANGPFLKEEWEKVRNSIGFVLDKNHNLEGMKNILSLSYNDLPYHLKTCLLYLSIFPEDFDIERDRLIGHWIAEGFISTRRGQRLQDVAESYFYELINKSMLHPVDIGYDGKARACRIHGMMLELITLKAIEENFITILGSQMVLENPYSNIRRLSVQYTGQEIKAELAGKDLCHARSLTAYGQIKYLPRLVEFEVLRVLDLEGCMGLEGYDLNNIDKMFQLRYLSLRSTRISTIPTQIMKLQNLETLDLRETCIMELPDGIVRLRRLLHLLAGSEDRGLPNIPNGIGSMTSLQVLSGFNICLSSASAVEELGNLTNLMELALGLDSGGSSNNKICEDMLLSSLCRLGSYKLQRLSIRSCHAAPLEFLDLWFPSPYFLQTFWMNTSSYYFAKIPKWMTPALTNLACLHINLREVTVEDLCIFGEFPALLFLEVWLDSDPAERLIILGEGFQILREFRLICDCGGAYLAFEEGAMPKVKKLCLPFHVSIAKMYDFYLGIEHLPCLKEVEVEMYHEGPKDLYTMAAAVAIENEANAHPNRPRVIVGPIDLVEGNEESSIMEAN